MDGDAHSGDVALAHAQGALFGLAIGDALGMPTQELTRSEILDQFGPLVTTFEVPSSDHPYAKGLRAGTVTDDTEQALLVAHLLIEERGGFDPSRFADELLEWEREVERRGLLDLLGPSTKRALTNLQAGMAPGESGRDGTTNGASMRICPVGITCSTANLVSLVDIVELVSGVTHNTGVALGGASAVAAAISAGVSGAPFERAVALAVAAASIGERRGSQTSDVSVSEAIQRALELGARARRVDVTDHLARVLATGVATIESVPAAFGVWAAYPDDPWMACRVAASLGGDCDTIAAMTGAMSGAVCGVARFPHWAREAIERRNGLGLDVVAQELLAIRR